MDLEMTSQVAVRLGTVLSKDFDIVHEHANKMRKGLTELRVDQLSDFDNYEQTLTKVKNLYGSSNYQG